MSKDYDAVIKNSKSYINSDSLKVDLGVLLGRTYTDKGDYKTAIPYLINTINKDTHNSWRKAWALACIGTCYFMTQNYDKSRKAIQECIELNSTKNATNYAHKRLLLFGFDTTYKNWEIVKSNNFRFHFQNMSSSDIKNFVSTRENAFQKINNFFNSKLPKKIDFFVWKSRNTAKILLNKRLGFANPEFCIVHSHYQQTKGHEMTHIISYYSTDIIKTTSFINEGTAVYFDQTNQDKNKIVKVWIKANDRKIKIKEIWANWSEFPVELSYPLSSLFVRELINNFGREKFIDFFKNQTYANAKLVFGNKLDKVIIDFEKQIN